MGGGLTLQSDSGSCATTSRPCRCPRRMMNTIATELPMNNNCEEGGGALHAREHRCSTDGGGGGRLDSELA